MRPTYLSFKVECRICKVISNFKFPDDMYFHHESNKSYLGMSLENCGHTYYIGQTQNLKIKLFDDIINEYEEIYRKTNSIIDYKKLINEKEMYKKLNGINYK